MVSGIFTHEVHDMVCKVSGIFKRGPEASDDPGQVQVSSVEDGQERPPGPSPDPNPNPNPNPNQVNAAGAAAALRTRPRRGWRAATARGVGASVARRGGGGGGPRRSRYIYIVTRSSNPRRAGRGFPGRQVCSSHVRASPTVDRAAADAGGAAAPQPALPGAVGGRCACAIPWHHYPYPYP